MSKEVQDHTLKPVRISNLESFVEEATIDLFDIGSNDKLLPVFKDELSEVYRFKQAPQNAKELAEMLVSKYRLTDESVQELRQAIDELVEFGFDIEGEHGFLAQALEEVIRDGTISVADDVAEKLGLVEATEAEPVPKATESTTELSWGRTGLIAALGIGFSTALERLRSKDKPKRSRRAKKEKQASVAIAA